VICQPQFDDPQLPTLPGQPDGRRVVQIASGSELRPIIALCNVAVASTSTWTHSGATGDDPGNIGLPANIRE
jgi:hypothetical protein